jgi:micrococcal nuclease
VKRLVALAAAHKAMTAVVLAGLVAGGAIAHAATGSSTTATVTKVVDGDTIDVEYGGASHRVRLLNIDAPESVDPGSPVECLGPEASEWLKQRLAVGTVVRLERDQETRDGYGRELAAVFDGEALINAEIARAGFGIAIAIGNNTKYLTPVEIAQREAQRAGRGLYSTARECTLPAQIEQLEATASTVLSQEPASASALSEFDAYAAELAAVLAAANLLSDLLDGDRRSLPLAAYTTLMSDFRYRVQEIESRLDVATAQNRADRDARDRQLSEEAQRATEEAARAAAEEAARRAAEESAEQRSSSSSDESSSHTSGPPPTQTTAPTRSPGGSGSGSSGYTGCRSYAPGGKTWTPIPC